MHAAAVQQAFHLEVVGGLMNVLAPYAGSTTVYLHPLNFPVSAIAPTPACMPSNIK